MRKPWRNLWLKSGRLILDRDSFFKCEGNYERARGVILRYLHNHYSSGRVVNKFNEEFKRRDCNFLSGCFNDKVCGFVHCLGHCTVLRKVTTCLMF